MCGAHLTLDVIPLYWWRQTLKLPVLQLSLASRSLRFSSTIFVSSSHSQILSICVLSIWSRGVLHSCHTRDDFIPSRETTRGLCTNQHHHHHHHHQHHTNITTSLQSRFLNILCDISSRKHQCVQVDARHWYPNCKTPLVIAALYWYDMVNGTTVLICP
jgi:hypothetical protein